MPTYSYACTACGHTFDIRQSFTDESLTVCPECEGRLRKVLGNVGVVFKGSGFYRTDSRTTASASLGASKPSGASSGSSPSGSSSSGSSGSSGSGSSSSDSSSSSSSSSGSTSSSSGSGSSSSGAA